MQYFSITLVSALSIGLVGMYLFMIYTVQRLTKEYNDLKVVEVSEMKNERYKFILEDKAIKGNVFQRHFSLIGMLKDNYNCFVLYCFYTRPLVLVLMLLGLQLPMTVLVYFFPPFKVQWVNRMSLITQVLYCLLDVVFIWNIAGGKRISTEDRYYYIGFSLIGLVIAVILCNMGFGTFYSMKETLKDCRKKREKERLKKQQATSQSQVQGVSPPGILESSRDESAIAGLSKPEVKTVNRKPKNRLMRNSIFNKEDSRANKNPIEDASLSKEAALQNKQFDSSKLDHAKVTPSKGANSKIPDGKSANLQKISNSTTFSNQDSLVEDANQEATSSDGNQKLSSSTRFGNNRGPGLFRGSGGEPRSQIASMKRSGNKGYIGEFRLKR
jgi:hypothetical protein